MPLSSVFQHKNMSKHNNSDAAANEKSAYITIIIGLHSCDV